MREPARTAAPLALLGLLFSLPASAGLHIWTGAASGNWSAPGNWQFSSAPAIGESASFSFSHMGSMVNDVSGLTITSMTFADSAYAVTGLPVTLSGTLSLSGGSTSTPLSIGFDISTTWSAVVDATSSRKIVLSGTLSGSGITVRSTGGGGTVILTASNTYTGPTVVESGTLEVTNGQALGGTAYVEVKNGASLSLINATVPNNLMIQGIGVSGNGALRASGTCAWTGAFNLQNSTTISSWDSLSVNAFGGTGDLWVIAHGPITQTVTWGNSWTGRLIVDRGTIFINGLQPDNPVTLYGSVSLGAVLRGRGTVGAVSIAPGMSGTKAIQPGDSATGILSTGSLNLTDTNLLTVVALRLGGNDAGTDYDQLRVTGSVNLANASLALSVASPLVYGHLYKLIDNDGTDPVVGTFSGLPHESYFPVGTDLFLINYAWGDGNDVIAMYMGSAYASATVNGNATICPGQSTTITASVQGLPPLDIVWSDGYSQHADTTWASLERSVSPATTTIYTVTSVTNSLGSGTSYSSATVTVDPVAPAVTPPAPITVDQTLCCGTFGGATPASSGALAAFVAGGSATDDCTPSPTRLAPRVGSDDVTPTTCFEAGDTRVAFRFQDATGNVGTSSSTVTIQMFGDLNVDRSVDPSDMVVLRAYFNFVLSPGVPPFYAPLGMADLDHSGVVDPSDMVLLRAFFNFAMACLA